MNLEIRPYQKDDEEKVIALWRECNLVVPWNNIKLDIERKLKVNPELFLIGSYNGEIVATAMGGYEGHRGWVNYLAVSKKYQRKGFGQQIMIEIENRLRAIGCPKINLQIRTTNAEAINFYKNIGYSTDQVICMGKRLIIDSGGFEYGK